MQRTIEDGKGSSQPDTGYNAVPATRRTPGLISLQCLTRIET